MNDSSKTAWIKLLLSSRHDDKYFLCLIPDSLDPNIELSNRVQCMHLCLTAVDFIAGITGMPQYIKGSPEPKATSLHKPAQNSSLALSKEKAD